MFFLVVLFLPLAGWLNGITPEIGREENRLAAQFPQWRWKKSDIKRFPGKFDAWFNDHMSYRAPLVNTYRHINHGWLNSSNTVLSGTDNWLYILREPQIDAARPPIISDYCGRNPLSPPELARWVSALLENWHSLQSQGRQYFLLMVPNKQTVYSRNLPPVIRCEGGETRLDQLVDALSVHRGFPLVDLRESLDPSKTNGKRLWYKSDTHWNGYGASLALDQLLSAIRKQTGIPLENALYGEGFRLSPIVTPGWGLSKMLGSAAEYTENEPQIVTIDSTTKPTPLTFIRHETNPLRQPVAYRKQASELPALLTLHDSFFNSRLKKLMAESFSDSTFVWHRGTPSLAQEQSLIKQISPEIVVHEMVERNLLHSYFSDR